MRIVIKNRGILMQVEDWFAEREGITKREAEVITETDKAVLLGFSDRDVWVPKSVITVRNIAKGLDKWS